VQPLRVFRYEPGFAATIVVVLALGVGVNATMYGLAHTLLLRGPAHVRDPGRVVAVPQATTYVRYLDLRSGAPALDPAAYLRRRLRVDLGPTPLIASVECVTTEFFRVLGVSPLIGRVISAQDGSQEGAGPVAVASHAFWRRYLTDSPAIDNISMRVGGHPHRLVGVAPEDFRGLEFEAVDLWIALESAPQVCSPERPLLASDAGGGRFLTVFGRIRDFMTMAGAEAQVRSVAASWPVPVVSPSAQPQSTEQLQPIHPPPNAQSRDRRIVGWLAGGAVALLLIASLNVGGLLAIRRAARRRETAIKLALGASPSRVLREIISEAVALGGVAILLAVPCAMLAARAVTPFFPIDAWHDLLRPGMFGVLASSGLVAAVLSALLPAIQAVRVDCRETTRTRTNSRRQSWFQTSVLVSQVALALVLTTGTGLFARSLLQVRSNLGFEIDHLLYVAPSADLAADDPPEMIRARSEAIRTRLERMPSVISSSLSSGSVLGSAGSSTVWSLRNASSAPPSQVQLQVLTAVSPEYFETVGTRLLHGRAFTVADDARSARVTIVNEQLAQALWPGQSAVGKCAVLGQACLEIVGVSESRRYGAIALPTSEFFVPFEQAPSREIAPRLVLVRTVETGDIAAQGLTSALRAAFPDLPLLTVTPISELADRQTKSWRLGARLFALYGTGALALATLAIYSTLTFATRRRTSEIGVRMALGATPGSVWRGVVGRGALLVSSGVAIGLVFALSVAPLMRGVLFGIAPSDPFNIGLAILVMAIAGLAGAALPAARASRTDPAVVLREE